MLHLRGREVRKKCYTKMVRVVVKKRLHFLMLYLKSSFLYLHVL